MEHVVIAQEEYIAFQTIRVYEIISVFIGMDIGIIFLYYFIAFPWSFC